ncbi:hypothetical protein HPB48_024633 [Haemaphysalis longicornis]|uniref:BTB domain-containing protein n=1 Tax=Haemaphysalis longicornis TaxID=44386 RepID=A0A9J6GYA5_HAELO|nr:hypothetical protein HPB48_024633 [Haemaphysalis longicornis]
MGRAKMFRIPKRITKAEHHCVRVSALQASNKANQAYKVPTAVVPGIGAAGMYPGNATGTSCAVADGASSSPLSGRSGLKSSLPSKLQVSTVKPVSVINLYKVVFVKFGKSSSSFRTLSHPVQCRDLALGIHALHLQTDGMDCEAIMLDEETGKKIESSTFSTAGPGNNKWRLNLYPNGSNEDSSDYVSLFLRLACSDKKDVIRFCEEISFVDSVNISSPNKVTAVNVPECQLSQDFGCLLPFRRFSDVVLRVRGKDIHAHKAIMAARSPVFAAMFEHEMKEKVQGRVKITDFSFGVSRQVIEFIYTDARRNSTRWLIKSSSQPKNVLCKKLSVGTAAEMLVLADMHNADQLKANTLRFIRANAAGVTETDGWKMVETENAHLVSEAFRALVVDNAAAGK